MELVRFSILGSLRWETVDQRHLPGSPVGQGVYSQGAGDGGLRNISQVPKYSQLFRTVTTPTSSFFFLRFIVYLRKIAENQGERKE